VEFQILVEEIYKHYSIWWSDVFVLTMVLPLVGGTPLLLCHRQ